MSTLGERLRSRRIALGLSRNKLAREAGIATGYICDLENGKKYAPSSPILVKLAKVLDISVDYLVGLVSSSDTIYVSETTPPITLQAIQKAHNETEALLAHLDTNQKNAVYSLVRHLARPTVLKLYPWVNRLPEELQEHILPIVAADWHKRYTYATDSEINTWPDDKLLQFAQEIWADYSAGNTDE